MYSYYIYVSLQDVYDIALHLHGYHSLHSSTSCDTVSLNLFMHPLHDMAYCIYFYVYVFLRDAYVTLLLSSTSIHDYVLLSSTSVSTLYSLYLRLYSLRLQTPMSTTPTGSIYIS